MADCRRVVYHRADCVDFECVTVVLVCLCVRWRHVMMFSVSICLPLCYFNLDIERVFAPDTTLRSLVAMGACTFTIVSQFGFARADQARVAASVASGVGFIGAGVSLFRAATNLVRLGLLFQWAYIRLRGSAPRQQRMLRFRLRSVQQRP